MRLRGEVLKGFTESASPVACVRVLDEALISG